MNRKELINRIYELDCISTKADATKVLDKVIDEIITSVKAGEKVTLGEKFGSFVAATQKAKSGKVNGVAYTSAEKQVIRFRPSAVLKRFMAE